MKHGSEWYKRDPAAYLGGVQGMTAKEHAVYSVTLDLIYQHGGSVNNDPSWIAGWIKDMGASAVRKSIQVLVDRKKLIIEGDQITQNRAKTEAKTKENLRETARENGKKGGEKSAENRVALSKNNALDEPVATGETQAEKTREDKRREESTNVLLAQSPSFSASDFQDFWDAYPHRNGKKGRPNAEKSFARAIKSGATLEQIAAGVSSMQNDPDVRKGFARDPTTWLNQKGWTDEFDAQQPQFKAINGGRYDQARHDSTEQRSDPTLEHIARLAGVGQASGDGRL